MQVAGGCARRGPLRKSSALGADEELVVGHGTYKLSTGNPGHRRPAQVLHVTSCQAASLSHSADAYVSGVSQGYSLNR